jgi:nitrate reductase gamma subunit
MYEFSRGPLVWIAFIVFVGGTIYRVIRVYQDSKKERVVHPYMSLRHGIRSIAHWLIPFGARNMRMRPLFTILSFLFHLCLLLTPIFLLGHVMLFEQSWGVSWWTLPDSLANVMTIVVVLVVIVFGLRRIAHPVVRFVTRVSDWVLLVIVAGPFVTGLMAYYQFLDYRTVMIVHMWSGALWLMVIPFTRIVHMIFFPFTRAYMGSEFGHVRNARDW